MNTIKRLISDIAYIFINYFVSYIPAWWIRKLIYKMLGMKIGHGSRIYMKCTILAPWRIEIGENTVVNEFVMLDGRGGLSIGSNCSISVHSILFTASHHINSEKFEYYKKTTQIGDGVWIGARAIVMAGSTINNNVVIGANSVTEGTKEYQSNGVYVGVPAEFKFTRQPDQVWIQNEAYFR